ncbi:MAG: type II secretion system protein N [Parvularculaceae bacterium]
MMNPMTTDRPQFRLSARVLAILAAAAAAVYCVVAAPASFVAALVIPTGAGVSIERTTGTIWNGAIEGVRAEGVLLGDISYATNAFALLTGRLAASLDASGGALAGDGKASIGVDGKAVVEEAQFIFELDAAARFAFLGAPLNGTVRADIDRLVVSRMGCLESEMTIRTDVLAAPAKRFAAEAFDLAGDAACNGRNFVVSLAGEGGEGAVTLSLSISPNLAYTLIAEAQPARTEVAEALQFLGFELTNGALTIGTTGVIHSVRS